MKMIVYNTIWATITRDLYELQYISRHLVLVTTLGILLSLGGDLGKGVITDCQSRTSDFGSPRNQN